MSIDYFLSTWKVTYSTSPVKVGQRVEIRRKPNGGPDALEFRIPQGKHGRVGVFGDKKWPEVKNLHYAPGSEAGTVIGSATVDGHIHVITIRGGIYKDGKKQIFCTVASEDFLTSLPMAKHIVADLSRFLHRFEDMGGGLEAALARIVRLVSKLGNILEAAGEWEAEDDGG